MARGKILGLGLALAGGAGYYLYNAGGDPKAAEKKFEHDLQVARERATASGQQLHTQAEKYGAQAGAQVDSAIAKATEEYNKASAGARDATSAAAKAAEQYAKDAQAKANKSIDEFDKKVLDTTAQAKSGLSSWFGGKMRRLSRIMVV